MQNVGLVRFDLNHDGIADFGLINRFRSSSSERSGVLSVVQSRQANEIWGVYSSSSGSQRLFAAALPRGTKVGPKGQFQVDPKDGLAMAASDFHQQVGPWLHVKQAYLGLKFVIKGKKHFGWARVKLSISGQSITAILTGYAYETIPGKPIITGATKGTEEQAGSLGALAAGASGFEHRKTA